MAEDLSALVEKGFSIALKEIVPYIYRELKASYGDRWWNDGIYSRLYEDQKPMYPETGNDDELVTKIDMALALKTIDFNWDIFRRKHSKEFRSWVNEVLAFRNKKAHPGVEGLKATECARALETLALLCGQIEGDAEVEIQKLVRIARYGSEQGSGSKKFVVKVKPAEDRQIPSMSGLPSWRSIMAPHPDVAEGRYRNAEFAADLSQVARGKASFEYLDPVEFFSRTYITEGLKDLLVQALKRITGNGGEPVVELKTAFGGGKTHSMLALYHMLGGKVSPERVPQLQPILAEAGLSSVPAARIAVIVGSSLSCSTSKRPQDMPGITVNTVWGEIAYQLAKSCEKPELYNIVKDADRKGINPGSETLAHLFTEAGPCMILLDELVAYGRTLYGVEGLPAGDYGNFLSFIQSITEAACECSNCMIVAAIPESDIEIGGESGQKVLEAFSHYFGRKEAIWKPVASTEGFEVVRRRLFMRCSNYEERTSVCEAFFKMYCDNPQVFPAECRTEAYLKRMEDCFPIHPEVFDRLYDDWSTLEKFQRTRGVLRLMAAVINSLWESNDPNPMIMPASIPLEVPAVKEELLRYLTSPEAWGAIVDTEVDGSKSQPAVIERANPIFGRYLSVRRVSRSLFFGSAPSKGQSNRGMSKDSIMLACLQPGEPSHVYADSLTKLVSSLAYLYTNASNDRFWFDTRPTLRKMMEDKARRIQRDVAYDEIKRVLRDSMGTYNLLAGVHACPSSSLDVPDDMEARLVIMGPEHAFGTDPSNTGDAEKWINEILSSRGTAPRIYKNMLVFCAPNSKSIEDLRDGAVKLLAWKEIHSEKDNYGLTAADARDVDGNIKVSDETLRMRIRSAYSWLFSPRINPDENLRDLILDPIPITASDSIVKGVEKELLSTENLAIQYAPILLMMELNKYLWRDRDWVSISEVWKCFCSYCYLPRLRNKTVFDGAILDGIKKKDYFGIAEGVNSDGKFINLTLGDDSRIPGLSDILVKPSAAEKQLGESTPSLVPEGNAVPPVTYPHSGPFGEHEGLVQTPPGPFGTGGGTAMPVVPVGSKERGFYLSADIDTARATRDIGKIIDEIVSHIQGIKGARTSIKIEVQSDFPAGNLSPERKRTVEENCRTLRISEFGFEE